MGETLKAIGCDVLSLARFSHLYNKYDDNILQYLFTKSELDAAKDYHRPWLYLSVSFAGKESVSKAIGRGMRGIKWTHIEILPDSNGELSIGLFDAALDFALHEKIQHWQGCWLFSEDLIKVYVKGF